MPKPRVQRLLGWLERHRSELLLAAVLVGMSLVAPKFLNAFNLTVITKAASLTALVAVGFTLVMICGELDLSIGATLTLGALLAIGLKPELGWGGSLGAALAAGAGVGLANGLLVAKARINSFIVTLGTLTIVQGLIYIYSRGASLSLTGVNDFAVANFLEEPLLPLLTPRVLVTLVLIVLFQAFLSYTRPGRNFHLVGGNKETAWVSGLQPDRYVIAAFVLSGALAALGGALYALSMCAATTDLGAGALMDVIAATIIGGTAMSGGKGSVLRSALAVLMFTALFNGFNRLGLGSEFRIFVSGLVLALVVLYEAWNVQRHEKVKGRRAALLEELARENP